MVKQVLLSAAILFLSMIAKNLNAQEELIIGFDEWDSYQTLTNSTIYEKMLFLSFSTPDCKEYNVTEVGVNINDQTSSGNIKLALYNTDRTLLWESNEFTVSDGVGEYLFQTIPDGIVVLNNLSEYFVAIIGTNGVYIEAKTNAENNGTATNMSASSHGMYDNNSVNYPSFPSSAVTDIHWYGAVSLVVKGKTDIYSDAGTNADIAGSLEYSLLANASADGEWSISSGGTGTFDDISSNTATFTADNYGTYILTWTIDDGTCITTDDIELNFIDNTGINNNSINDFSVFPNPSKEYIYTTGISHSESYSIYNLLGKNIETGIIKNNRINIQNFKKGIYFLKLNNNSVTKFIKE